MTVTGIPNMSEASPCDESVDPSNSVIAFISARDRDAWATIRGYVYQVDLTILRWLTLRDGEALELERGEDVDWLPSVFTSELPADAAARDRLLEQIKHRDAKLTLRADSARAALANALEHRRANPGLKLFVRYTTNAEATTERRTTMPGLLAGVEAWERLRSAIVSGALPADASAYVLAIRGLLTGPDAPEGVTEDSWAQFQAFVHDASEDDFLDFVGNFEWATAAPNAPSMANVIEKELCALGYADDALRARALYQHLFVSVIKRLSMRGIKRLTLQELEDERIAAKGPSHETERIIRSVVADVYALTSEISEVRKDFGALRGALELTNIRLEALANDAGIRASLDLAAFPPPLESPPPSPLASPRAETVTSLLGDTAPGTLPRVIVLFGASSSGKTQLAARLAERIAQEALQGGSAEVRWIRFGELDAHGAAARLVAAIKELGATAVAQGGTLALDDVPPFREGDEFGMRLLPLIRACLAQGTWVVCTSQLPLSAVDASLAANSLQSVSVPPFTESETRDVLAAYEAPDWVLARKFVALVNARTAGHPVLLHALAQYLRTRQWGQDAGEVLQEIFADTFAQQVNQDTYRALLHGVADAETRDLLYRLALLDGVFGREEVDALANVTPPIAARGERFAQLVGPWVQREASDRYELSPLVKRLGSEDLSASTKRACHSLLARRIVSRESIGELDAVRALNHFISAEEFDAAGILIVHGLRSATGPGWQGRVPTLALAWTSTPLPERMSRHVRLIVRAQQAAFLLKVGRNADHVLTDLDAMLREPVQQVWAESTASILVAIAPELRDGRLAATFMGHALRRWDAMVQEMSRLEGDGVIELDAMPSLEVLIWIAAGRLDTDKDFDAWISEVETLPPATTLASFGSIVARDGSEVTADNVFERTLRRPADERDWAAAVGRLARMERLGQAIGAPLLFGYSRAAQMKVVAEGIGDINGALALAETTIRELSTNYSLDPDAYLSIVYSAGLLLYDAKRFADAAAWYHKGERVATKLSERTRTRLLVHLAQALQQLPDRSGALAAAEAAAELAREAASSYADRIQLPTVRQARSGLRSQGAVAGGHKSGRTRRSEAPEWSLRSMVQGELAIARWLAGDLRGAAASAVEMIEFLLACRDDEDTLWKRRFAASGHVSGYLMSLVKFGGVPDGDYLPPRQGLLLSPPAGTETNFRPDRVSLIQVHAMYLARAAGDQAGELEWARRAAKGMRSAGQWMSAIAPLDVILRDAVMTCVFSDAIEAAVDVASAYVVFSKQVPDVDLAAAVERPRATIVALGTAGTATEAAWETVDQMAMHDAVLPSFLRVARSVIENAPDAPQLAMTLIEALKREGAEAGREVGAAGADANPWIAASNLCCAIFVDRERAGDLLARARPYQSVASEAWRTVGVLGVLGATLSRDATVELACRAHLGVAEYVAKAVSSRQPLLYESVVVPFFTSFWTTTFHRGRFLFQMPQRTESELVTAIESPLPTRLQRLLRAVAVALGILPPRGSEAWFEAP